MEFENKYIKYKNKYLESKEQYGGKVGDFYDYSNDKTIKKLFYVKEQNILCIYWSLHKYVHTSPIKKSTVVNDKLISITKSGSVYITKYPIKYDLFPAFTKYDKLF